MIKTMNKQRVEFEIKMREFDMRSTLGLVLLNLMFVCVMMVRLFLL